MPALVVPPVATTPITSSARESASSAARKARPVRRWSSVGMMKGSTPMTWSALPTEEWASSLMAMRGRAGAWPPRRWPAVSRATKQPPAPSGNPA